PQPVAGSGKLVGVVAFVFRRDDEKAARVLDTVGMGIAQDGVFGDALLGAARVFDDVAPAAVDKPVIAPGCAVGQVALFDQDYLNPTQRRIPRHTCAGGTAADHQEFSLKLFHGNYCTPERGGGQAVSAGQKSTL